MADLCLIPQVYNANRFGVDMSQFPLLARLIRICHPKTHLKLPTLTPSLMLSSKVAAGAMNLKNRSLYLI